MNTPLTPLAPMPLLVSRPALPCPALCSAQYFAHLRIIPFAAILSEPTPGCHLIELDAVAVSMPHRPWFAPITWLLPAKVAKNVHLKIGVSGPLENGKVRSTIMVTGGCCAVCVGILRAVITASNGRELANNSDNNLQALHDPCTNA